MAIERIKRFFSSKLPLYSKAQLDEQARKAAEQAMLEERKWFKSSTHSLDTQEAHDSIGDDFWLYEQTRDRDPDIGPDPESQTLTETQKHIRKKEKKATAKVVESFTGGWHSRLDRAYYQSLDQLLRMQEASVSKYHSDPHARSIIENWVNYTIGGGLKFNIDDHRVFRVIKDFRKRNDMKKREKRLLRMAFMEGELFINIFSHPGSGNCAIRRIPPKEIVEMDTHPDDMETILAYHWQYVQAPHGTAQTYPRDKWVQDIKMPIDPERDAVSRRSPKNRVAPNQAILYTKLGMDHELRGRVPLQPVMRFLKYYEDWLVDRIRLNHERSKVTWIESRKGRGLSSAYTQSKRAPKGGIMLIETDDVQYRIESAELQSDDAKEDGMAILHAIGAGTILPIHILNQRSDMQVYASIRKADSPFSQFIRSNQEFFAEEFEKLYRYVIDKKVEAGVLPKSVKVVDYSQEALINAFDKINRMYVEGKSEQEIVEEITGDLAPEAKERRIPTSDVPLGIEFPEVIKEDPKSQADVLKIHKEMGIASRSTLAARAGYNWQRELVNMMKENDQFNDQDSNDNDQDPPSDDNDDDSNDGEE